MDIVEAYRKILTIRYFEEKVDWLFARGLLGGTTHLCIGQEAVAVGVAAALDARDYVVSNHRGHGHLIARGAAPSRIFAELLGKREGYCMGKGGTQHICVAELNFLGTNGITGGGIPIATGVGLSIRLLGDKKIAVAFFGDGASNQGVFHESLNMASIWDLPVLYVCENNMYAMSTSFTKSSKLPDVAHRAASYGIPSDIVDGMDVEDVFDGARRLAEKARHGGPALLEAKTYRFCGHSKSDPRSYRTRNEEEQWRSRDPVALLEKRLIENGAGVELIKASVRDSIKEAYERARCGGDLTQEDALDGVYAGKKDLLPQGNI